LDFLDGIRGGSALGFGGALHDLGRMVWAATSQPQSRSGYFYGGIWLALLLVMRSSIFVVLVVGLFFLLTRQVQAGDPVIEVCRKYFTRLLGNRVTRLMADISYGVYLVHVFFISLAGSWLYHQPVVAHLHPYQRVMVLTFVTLGGSYAVAWILHHLVEKPGIELGRKILTSRPPTKVKPLPSAISSDSPVAKNISDS